MKSLFGEVRHFLVNSGSYAQLFPDAHRLCPVPSSRLNQAFAASSVLLGLDVFPQETAFQPKRLIHADQPFNLVLQPLPDAIWRALPFASHRICRNQAVLTSLEAALNLIEDHYPHYLPWMADVMPNIAVVEIKEAYRGKDSQITSSSFPVLPYVGFVSAKAMRHIPPNTVMKTNSPSLLAENLVHEAIHQVVNLSLLRTDIFVERYTSRTSPKIEVLWRYGQRTMRNQRWELDRTLHAAIVYLGLLSFRQRELERRRSEEADFMAFRHASTAAVEVLPYLCAQLNRHRGYLTSDGNALLDALRLEQERKTARMQEILNRLDS